MKVDKVYAGLCREETAAGTIRWRVRVEGQKARRITVPVSPDDPDFEDHYLAARAGQRLEKKPAPTVRKNTLDELASRFLKWMGEQVEAGNLSEATLASRRTGLRQACDCPSPNGPMRMGAMRTELPREAFGHIRDSFGTRTGAAQTCLKVLRAAYRWGEDHGYPVDSPVHKVKSNHVEKGGAEPWSDDDVKRFLACHGPGTMARRWFLLAKLTAGRIGDMHLLGPQNERVRDDRLYIRYQPGKRGSSLVELPLPFDFMMEIADLPADARAYLLTEHGEPFASSGALDNRVRKWILAAGLSEPMTDHDGNVVLDANGRPKLVATRSQHGIRKRRAEQIAEASGSVYEVMAHLSHSDPKTSTVYTKRVNRARLAERAALRAEAMSAAQGVPRPQNRGALEGEKPTNTRG
jgi:integrase